MIVFILWWFGNIATDNLDGNVLAKYSSAGMIIILRITIHTNPIKLRKFKQD